MVATIYQKNGQSLYDVGGTTYDAKTGRPAEPVNTFGQPISKGYGAIVPTLFSSERGKDIINDKKKIEQSLGGGLPQSQIDAMNQSSVDAANRANASKKQEPTATPTTVTLINPNTEQTVTFQDASINRENIQSYLNGGWTMSEGAGNVPDWLRPSKDGSFSTVPATEYDTAKADLTTARSNLANLNVNNDPVLKQMLSNISQQWDTRIAEMEQANKSRQASLSTTGIRLGSRYTGGMQGMFGGILSAEETQASGRIATLESQKSQALLEARNAYQNQEWTKYSKAVDTAQRAYDQQLQAVTELNKAQVTQTQKLKDEARLGTLSTAVAGLMKRGVTDSKDLISFINEFDDGTTTGANLTAKELKEMRDTFDVENPEVKGIGELYKSLSEAGNVPIDAFSKVQGAKSLGEAYQIAAPYFKQSKKYPAGIIGEYQFYVDQATASGKTPVDFESYQNQDANRKRQVININGGGLTPQENQTYLTITNKYQADPIINAAIKGGQINALADQIIANPNSATNQLASLYIFVKNLDPDSAVREGELALANQTQSYLQKFGNTLARIQESRVVSPQSAKELAEATKRLVATWEQTAEKKTALYKSQAKNSSPNVGNAFNSYMSDFSSSLTTDQSIEQSEESAKQQVAQLYGAHGDTINALLNDNPNMSWNDVLQVISE